MHFKDEKKEEEVKFWLFYIFYKLIYVHPNKL